MGLIGLEYLNDGGADFSAWEHAPWAEMAAYYTGRIGIVGIIFVAGAGGLGIFRRKQPE